MKNNEKEREEEKKEKRDQIRVKKSLFFTIQTGVETTRVGYQVDGTGFHEVGSKQAERDIKKNSILEKCAVSLLRFRTDGSGEKEKLKKCAKEE